MNTVETLRNLSEVWGLFAALPDEATINVDLAAIFLGMSVKTLARLRQNGGGPPYYQANEEGSTARNQRVNYILGDLRAWRESKKVDSAMDAAKVRGLTFSTLNDLLEEQPFWRVTTTSMVRGGGIDRGQVEKRSAAIVGHVQCVPDDEFRALLENEDAEVVWLPMVDAMTQPWAAVESRQPFHGAYVELLQRSLEQENSQHEAAMLCKGLT